MRVQPKTEQEVQEANLLDKGEYDFVVMSAEETQSKAGNDMIALKISVMDEEERGHTVFDYLVSTDAMSYKLRHFAASIGLLADYEGGNLPAEKMEGRAGRCTIVVTPARDGYAAKNSVQDYIAADGPIDSRLPAAEKKSNAKELDDEIPFDIAV